MLKILTREIHLKELKADIWQFGQVQLICVDEFTEELSDLLEVQYGSECSLSLASGLAPFEELVIVALDWRISKQVVYDLELCL